MITAESVKYERVSRKSYLTHRKNFRYKNQ